MSLHSLMMQDEKTSNFNFFKIGNTTWKMFKDLIRKSLGQGLEIHYAFKKLWEDLRNEHSIS